MIKISVNCKLSRSAMTPTGPTARTRPDSKNFYLCKHFIELIQKLFLVAFLSSSVLDRKATGKRQGSDRGATGERQGSDKQATGERQGAKSAKKATGRRQGGNRMATGERGGPNLLVWVESVCLFINVCLVIFKTT